MTMRGRCGNMMGKYGRFRGVFVVLVMPNLVQHLIKSKNETLKRVQGDP